MTAPPTKWIHPAGWDGFLHYSGRDPKWIKNQTSLLHDHAYLELPEGCRAVLHGIWLEYASSHAQVPLDTRSLSRRLNLRVTSAQLKRLNHAGFLTFSASRTLSQKRIEKSREEKKDQKQEQTRATTDNLVGQQRVVSEILTVLWQVPKPGYAAAKFTEPRVVALAAKHPALDLVDEAEKLRDWEMYGGGEKIQTKDGIARFRRWLGKAAEPGTNRNGHHSEAEVDYPWLPGCEPKT